jgi:hypothetical protein
LRVIIVVVTVGAVKIYVAAMEALKIKEGEDETQFIFKINGFLRYPPFLNANVLFCRVFFL